MLRNRATADDFHDPGDEPRRVNRLNWAGKGRPEGLFPPKRDPEAQGGSVEVSSRPGRTTFTVRLPLVQAGRTVTDISAR